LTSPSNSNRRLAHAAKHDLLATLERQPISAPGATSLMFRQQEPLGLGHAVWCGAAIWVGGRAFPPSCLRTKLLWNPARPCLQQMAETHASRGGNVIAVMEVPEDHTNRYGIVDPGETQGPVTEVKGFVEKAEAGHKPRHGSPPSADTSYKPEVFALLSEGTRGAGNEIQLTDALLRS